MTSEAHTPLAGLPVRVGARVIALRRLDRALAARERLAGERDDEALHDFRVALRRLRTGMRAYRRWLDDTIPKSDRHAVRDSARATGGARDIEVQLEWLGQATLEPPASDGASLLRERLEARRKGADRAALRAAHRFPAEAHRLRRRLSRYTGVVDARSPGVVTTGAITARLALGLLAELESCCTPLREEGDPRSAHRARIRGKRLRYLIEPFAEETDTAEPALELLRELQDALGELHDLDLLIELAAAGTETAGPPGNALDHIAWVALVEHLRGRRAGLLDSVRERHLGERAAALAEAVRAFAAAVGGDGYEGFEIERKYLLTGLPRRRKDRSVVRIDQGWLPGVAIQERLRRVRAADGATRYLRTIKLGRGLVRREVEEDLDEETFRALWPHTRGRRLSKRRYSFRDGGRVWIVDRFLDRDLVLAEIELDSPDDEVEPPAWLRRWIDREVTGVPDYLNVNLAGAAGGPGHRGP